MRWMPWLLLAALPAAAQLWTKTRAEVKPGQGIGPIVLGKPLGAAAQKYLGKASQSQAANDKPLSGYALYGSGDKRDLRRGILVSLHDGKDPKNVGSVKVRGIRASTREGVFLDASSQLILKKYPEAQQDLNPFTRQPEFVLPGLIIRTRAGKVEEFQVEPRESQRWRFAPLEAVPARKLGPFEMGKAVPEEAFQLLGPPTYEVKPGKTPSSGLLRWAVPGQNPHRIIEVVLHNGQSPRAVVSVKVRGVKAQTDQSVKLGDPADTVRDLYPDGREGLNDQVGAVAWRVPGANFIMKDGVLREIFVYDVPRDQRRR